MAKQNKTDTPQLLYNTFVGAQANFNVSYPISFNKSKMLVK